MKVIWHQKSYEDLAPDGFVPPENTVYGQPRPGGNPALFNSRLRVKITYLQTYYDINGRQYRQSSRERFASFGRIVMKDSDGVAQKDGAGRMQYIDGGVEFTEREWEGDGNPKGDATIEVESWKLQYRDENGEWHDAE